MFIWVRRMRFNNIAQATTPDKSPKIFTDETPSYAAVTICLKWSVLAHPV